MESEKNEDLIRMGRLSMPGIEHVHLDETVSTSTYVKDLDLPEPGCMAVASADFQFSGRGQRGNSWESERGKNLSFSILFRPDGIKASVQFVISQAISVSICEALACLGIRPQVKWPNDIYVGDGKICGILIENVLSGKMIERCVIGIGINVNQRKFTSDAPNPVSLAQLLGRETSRMDLLENVLSGFRDRMADISASGSGNTDSAYRSLLYHSDGRYTYEDESGRFEAIISDIEPDGHLILEDSEGRKRRYAFKEVKTIIGDRMSF